MKSCDLRRNDKSPHRWLNMFTLIQQASSSNLAPPLIWTGECHKRNHWGKADLLLWVQRYDEIA